VYPGAMPALRITASVALAVAIVLSPPVSANAFVLATDPSDESLFFTVYLWLFKPTGELDEAGLSGFEFLISSETGGFDANDQYLIAGEKTLATTSLGHDLGGVGDLSGVPFGFSIRHNLEGGRNFTFRLTRQDDPATSSVLCWGENCPSDSIQTEVLNGLHPIQDYNALQIQVRAQEVEDSSAEVTIDSLSGVDLFGAPLFDEVVTPDAPGTLLVDQGRRGQWLLGTDLDLVENEWELSGTVTLTRPDEALSDRTKVRLAVDLVRHQNLPFLPPPKCPWYLTLAAALALLVLGLLGLWLWRARRSARP
jgi:hypothetical protein